MRKPLRAAIERLDVAADLRAALARIEFVRAGDRLEQQRVVGDIRRHRPARIERDLQRPDARIGNETEGGLETDDAAMARRDADRAGLIAADRHVDVARRHQRGAARRRAAGRISALARVVHRSGRARVAAAGDAVIFAHGLAGDLAAGIEDARDDRGVDLRHVAVEKRGADHHRHAGEAHIVLERDTPARELAGVARPDRRFHVPGAMRILRRTGPREPPFLGDDWNLVRGGVERRVGIGERPDDPGRGLEIGIARMHAEPGRGLAQVGDAGFDEHGARTPPNRRLACRHRRPRSPRPGSGANAASTGTA